MGPMIVIMAALAIGLVVALVLAINALYPSAGQGDRRPPTPAHQPPTAAEAELELRYARGEIDAETLARQRAVLRQ
ncbi:putative membrane protein [Phycicoccus badiiscoriae]|uniref:Putative membrane protein n=1 Tax=Pedococcus badiiscoriae TaxID=642776 RepID=A0A852WE34_9MICO|nr:SHOCT domain-containing protein [Pedococcus badiiscoriae]NYG05661.1 putative membrane protein [Pedococcus badiiscoriae]